MRRPLLDSEFRSEQGQALIELLIIGSTLCIVFAAGLPILITALQERHHHIDQSRSAILQPLLEDSVPLKSMQVRSDYQLSQSLGSVFRPLTRMTGLQLPFRNLYETQTGAAAGSNEGRPKLALLRDGWSAATPSSLQDAPAGLVPSAYLQRVGIKYVQQAVGWLPNAREFGPTQLRLGYVNDEVVPAGTLCRGRWLC